MKNRCSFSPIYRGSSTARWPKYPMWHLPEECSQVCTAIWRSGAADSGSDGWMYQDVLTKLATMGAPPDDFNAHGQN